VLTVSDGVVAGTREDKSGDALEELLRSEGFDVERRVVADERDEIAAALRELAASARVVLTTGGTGLAPRDVTPEATRDVLDREARLKAYSGPMTAAAAGAERPPSFSSEDAARAALARRRRRRRLDARRQPSRLARRLPRRLRGAAPGARARARAARRRA